MLLCWKKGVKRRFGGAQMEYSYTQYVHNLFTYLCVVQMLVLVLMRISSSCSLASTVLYR